MGEAKRRQGAQAEQGDQRFMPRFAFIRRLDLEREAGLLLAGTLIVDIPKSRKTPLPHEEQMIAEIIRELVDAAEAGKLPDDANRSHLRLARRTPPRRCVGARRYRGDRGMDGRARHHRRPRRSARRLGSHAARQRGAAAHGGGETTMKPTPADILAAIQGRTR